MELYQKNSLQGLAVILIALGLSACGSQNENHRPLVEAISGNEIDSDLMVRSPASFTPSKIIGINPLIKVKADGSNIETTLRQTLDAYGVIDMSGLGSCSGTHIGNGYVITAGHCFLERADGSMAPSASNQSCKGVKVNWGYRGSPATGSPKPVVNLVSNCTKLVYAELNQNRDFAIFTVDQAPKTKVALSADTKRTADKTKLTIFGFPQGRPLEWSQYCPLVNTQSITGLSSQIGPNTDRFAYQCDTEPGNSGSAVLSVTTNGTPKVVGIHNAAAPAAYAYNIATYLYDIRKVLLSKKIDIDQLVK